MAFRFFDSSIDRLGSSIKVFHQVGSSSWVVAFRDQSFDMACFTHDSQRNLKDLIPRYLGTEIPHPCSHKICKFVYEGGELETKELAEFFKQRPSKVENWDAELSSEARSFLDYMDELKNIVPAKEDFLLNMQQTGDIFVIVQLLGTGENHHSKIFLSENRERFLMIPKFDAQARTCQVKVFPSLCLVLH